MKTFGSVAKDVTANNLFIIYLNLFENYIANRLLQHKKNPLYTPKNIYEALWKGFFYYLLTSKHF